jgi:vacuolar-type H+-ATPase subunit E/Vma4
MGTAVCAAVAADPALSLVAAVDPHAAGQVREGVTIAGEPGDFAAGVVVRAGRSVHDFSLPALLARQRERWELPVGRILFTA